MDNRFLLSKKIYSFSIKSLRLKVSFRRAIFSTPLHAVLEEVYSCCLEMQFIRGTFRPELDKTSSA